MRKYAIPVTWSMCGSVVVEAENLDDAVKLASFVDLPENSSYIEDSFVVNVDEMADNESDYYVIEYSKYMW